MVLTLRSYKILSLFIISFIFIGCGDVKTDNTNRFKNSDASFFLEENEVVINESANIETANGETHILVNSEKDINLRWKTTKVEVPSDWNVYFCDNVVCHFDLPDSVDIKPINKNTMKNRNHLKLYVNPNEVKGEGFVQIAVFNINRPTEIDTVNYRVVIN